ncbi:hypothetical protein GIB67_037574 [Kingdonia uniflora]|uniref:Uncharacterized protein n=1 Tax=Kingdonia uniflora TaxID=39325 RepID=A0A7J7LSB0_9MAGN|nr:hypothetical protein GIB67_037574 [Kingdonia uniflora]
MTTLFWDSSNKPRIAFISSSDATNLIAKIFESLLMIVVILTEFSKLTLRTTIGFVVMGFVGFFMKLIFIPINNIIIGSV